MTPIVEICQRVLGCRHTWIPAGPALVYCYRRFGFTEHGSDDYKQLCKYYIPTAVDGLHVGLFFGGMSCYIHDSMSQELMVRYTEDERKPYKQWWERCRQWAAAQGTPLYADGIKNPELYLTQAGEWLAEQGVTHVLTQDEWDKQWSQEFYEVTQAHQTQMRDAYLQIEPFPNDPVTEFMQQCHDAFEAALVDLLRPVQVRDVFINILGKAEDNLGEWDEEKEAYASVAEPSFMAGYGVVTEVYKDFDLYLDYLDFARKQGNGDLIAGMKAVLETAVTQQEEQSK